MALDNNPIVVNLSDNSRLSYNGSLVKMKGTVLEFSPILNNGSKDFYIKVLVQYYINNSGSYGSTVLSTIQNDATLSDDQKSELLSVYSDKTIIHSTQNLWVDSGGNLVSSGTVGAITELEYWQNFQLGQVSGITGTTMSAMGAMYAIITAIVNKLNTRKKW